MADSDNLNEKINKLTNETFEWKKPFEKEWLNSSKENTMTSKILNPQTTFIQKRFKTSLLTSCIFIIPLSAFPISYISYIQTLKVYFYIIIYYTKLYFQKFPYSTISVVLIRSDNFYNIISTSNSIKYIKRTLLNFLKTVKEECASLIHLSQISLFNYILEFCDAKLKTPIVKQVIFLGDPSNILEEFKPSLQTVMNKVKTEKISFHQISFFQQQTRLQNIVAFLSGKIFYDKKLFNLVVCEMEEEEFHQSRLKNEIKNVSKDIFLNFLEIHKEKERCWKKISCRTLTKETEICDCHFERILSKMGNICSRCKAINCKENGFCVVCNSLLINFADLGKWFDFSFSNSLAFTLCSAKTFTCLVCESEFAKNGYNCANCSNTLCEKCFLAIKNANFFCPGC